MEATFTPIPRGQYGTPMGQTTEYESKCKACDCIHSKRQACNAVNLQRKGWVIIRESVTFAGMQGLMTYWWMRPFDLEWP